MNKFPVLEEESRQKSGAFFLLSNGRKKIKKYRRIKRVMFIVIAAR